MDSRIAEAEKKLDYADFLMRSQRDEFKAGALSHISVAAGLAARALADIDEKMAGSPRFVQQTLEKFDEPEVKRFVDLYVKLAYRTVSASSALTGVRQFVSWLKLEKEKLALRDTKKQ